MFGTSDWQTDSRQCERDREGCLVQEAGLQRALQWPEEHGDRHRAEQGDPVSSSSPVAEHPKLPKADWKTYTAISEGQ